MLPGGRKTKTKTGRHVRGANETKEKVNRGKRALINSRERSCGLINY